MARKPFSTLFQVLVVSFFVSSCGAESLPKKLFKVLADPKIEVGEPKDQPSVMNMTIFAQPGANVNQEGQAVPIDVWVYQLTEIDKFVVLDFDELTQEPKKNLASHFLYLKEVQIDPGKSKVIADIEIEEDATYMAIVGGYADINRVEWSNFTKIKDVGEAYTALVLVQPDQIAIDIHR